MRQSTQKEKLLAWMKKGFVFDPIRALQWLGCFRLGARIYELKKEGYNISTTLKTINGKRYAEYRLIRGKKW